MGTPYGSFLDKYSGGLNNVAGQYGASAQRARQFGAQYTPQYQSSIGDLATLLRRRATGGDRAAYMSEQLGNSNRAGLSALSALHRDNALAGGANPYSAGQEAILRGQMAANNAGAANNAANYYENDQNQRAQQLAQLFGGIVGQSNQDEMGALGAEHGIDSGLLQTYLQMSNAEKERAAQAKQGFLGSLGGLLGTAGQIYGMTRPGPRPR